MHASARRTALRALARGVSSSASTNACATRTNATAFLASRASTSPSLPARVRAASRARRAFASDTHDDFKPKVADASNEDVERAIESDVQTNAVLIYMKGSPSAPQCGFSNMACRILDHHGVEYASRNVLASEELRNGIKAYSAWPTIPQLYVKGEFVGGSDIMMSMHQSGELAELVKDVAKRAD
jgi:monothiol glutaredoxin